MPSNNTPGREFSIPAGLLPRILDVEELVELDVVQTAFRALDAAYVYGLHDVTRFGVDVEGTAGALKLEALEHRHGLVRVELSPELPCDLVDRSHPVVARHRHEVRTAPVAVRLGVRLLEGVILGPFVSCRVVMRGEDPEGWIAHHLEHFV